MIDPAAGVVARVRRPAPRNPAVTGERAPAEKHAGDGRRCVARNADARRLAAAAALAVALDLLALVLLSIFLTGAEVSAAREERASWLAVDLQPPDAALRGTELPPKRVAEAVRAPAPSVPASQAAPVRAESEDGEPAPIPTEAAAAGTELEGRTASSAADNCDALSPDAGTELAAARAGTELTTSEDLLLRLDAEIARALVYPPRARARGIEGRVLLGLRVDEAGRLEACSVATSSGSDLLDGAARRLIARIFPLPARLASSFSALVAVEYRLR